LEKNLRVEVRRDDVNQAMRVLKKKLQKEGVFKELRRKQSFEKPSEKRRRQKAEAKARHKKALKKRNEDLY
jgi:small subunit ribosomal protein S21